MPDYRIFDHGEEINCIVADEEFIGAYCTENGYTYELRPGQEPEEPAQEPDPQADTDAMLVDLSYRLTLLELGL